MKTTHLFARGLVALVLWLPLSLPAQWLTQSITVKPGWSAVYLHVDASYTNLDYLVGGDLGNPIVELWLWQAPPSTLQFVTSPQAPLTGNSQWANWARIGLGISSTLNALVPNAAYLVHSVAATNYTWNLKGKVVPPSYSWSVTGLNFLGFPTPSAGAPMFDSFLSLAPAFQTVAEIYQYQGGNLGATNPVRLFAWHTTPVTRGQAFWMRTGTLYNNYFGPFQATLQNPAGVAFADTASQYSFTLANVTASNVTVTARLLASETPPALQSTIAGVPPLLVRGALSVTNLTYAYTNLPLGGSLTWQLAPQGQAGASSTVVLGLNRYALSNAPPGTSFAGILRLSDNLGFSQVDLPVTATAASTAGLWIGNASVTQVRNYLTDAIRDTNGSPVFSTNGVTYLMTNVNNSLGAVAAPFPLRLILHNDGANVTLLQRVFYGVTPYSNSVLTTTQDVLDPTRLASARRISANHLPWSKTNVTWAFAGHLVPGAVLTTTVPLDYADQASNPFLHTYHPDHNNLDSTFSTQLPVGSESYSVSRLITLTITPPGNDFSSLTSAGQSISGTYNETLNLTALGGATRSFDVAGSFALNRISSIATLTRP